jgi:hypothetical protein
MKSIRPAPLGCFSFTAVLALVVTLAVIASLTILRGGAMFTPGVLNAQVGPLVLGGVTSHAQITNCSTCHTPPWSSQTMADQCLACHTDLKQDPNNFHNLMIAQGVKAGCNQCHTDHSGATASLTFASVSSFPHNLVGYSLTGHQIMADGSAFICLDCHSNGYIGYDQSTCTTCHTTINAVFMQEHVATFGATCLSCHDGIYTYGHTFNHSTLAFALTGAHASLTCDQCHAGARTIADLQAAPQNCYACHANDDAHQGQFGQDCAACHSTTAWQPASFDHSKSAFPLTGAHTTVECNQCHLPGPDGVTVFQGTPTTCVSCHAQDDAHQGQFGQDCAACHSTTAWQPASFDHSKSAFPLTGAHLTVPCNQCHLPGQNGVTVFKGTSTTCVSCHPDPTYHAGLFGTDCAGCHTTTAWTPATFNQAHTFPLNHGDASTCQSCHPNSLTIYTCYTCHDQAQTVARHQEEGITNISNCIQCHANGRGEGD